MDVVLGILWLQTLVSYSANHQKQFIKFKWEGHKYKLYGFQPLENQIVSSFQMMKMIWKGAPAYVVQCHQLEMLTSNMVNKEAPKVQELIQKHKKVFQFYMLLRLY